LVVKVPLDRGLDGGFEFVLGRPAEFAVDFAGADRVPAVVAGEIAAAGESMPLLWRLFVAGQRGRLFRLKREIRISTNRTYLLEEVDWIAQRFSR
jgi:hypothetical protein